jgi:hypothetical protein
MHLQFDSEFLEAQNLRVNIVEPDVALASYAGRSNLVGDYWLHVCKSFSL